MAEGCQMVVQSKKYELLYIVFLQIQTYLKDFMVRVQTLGAGSSAIDFTQLRHRKSFGTK